MDIVTIVLMGFGLAMDAFAVSVTSGSIIRELRIRHALKIALAFGLFQAVMPLIGYMAGLGFRDFISDIDHWIAFGLLTAIGCKMIYESFQMDAGREKADPLDMYVLLMLSLATSIDALAVGLSFALLKIVIAAAVLIIGGITFLVCFAGTYIGNRLGHFFERRIEILGGLILIGIGVKILIEHLT